MSVVYVFHVFVISILFLSSTVWLHLPHVLSLLQHHHTHLSVPCASSLVVSFPVLGGGASLGTVAALLSTACPAGQRRGWLAEGSLPAGQLRLGGPLKARQRWGWHRLLLLLWGPLGPGRQKQRTSQTDRRIDWQTARLTCRQTRTLCCCSCDGTWTCPPTCISCSPAWMSLHHSEGKKKEKGKLQTSFLMWPCPLGRRDVSGARCSVTSRQRCSTSTIAHGTLQVTQDEINKTGLGLQRLVEVINYWKLFYILGIYFFVSVSNQCQKYRFFWHYGTNSMQTLKKKKKLILAFSITVRTELGMQIIYLLIGRWLILSINYQLIKKLWFFLRI